AAAEFRARQPQLLSEKIDEQRFSGIIGHLVQLFVYGQLQIDVQRSPRGACKLGLRASNILPGVMGRERNLLPVAWVMALARAGNTGHNTASAMPRGDSSGAGSSSSSRMRLRGRSPHTGT